MPNGWEIYYAMRIGNDPEIKHPGGPPESRVEQAIKNGPEELRQLLKDMNNQSHFRIYKAGKHRQIKDNTRAYFEQ